MNLKQSYFKVVYQHGVNMFCLPALKTPWEPCHDFIHTGARSEPDLNHNWAKTAASGLKVQTQSQRGEGFFFVLFCFFGPSRTLATTTTAATTSRAQALTGTMPSYPWTPHFLPATWQPNVRASWRLPPAERDGGDLLSDITLRHTYIFS